MTDYLQHQTQGTTSAQQGSTTNDVQPPHIVRYNYSGQNAVGNDIEPSGVVFTHIETQDLLQAQKEADDPNSQWISNEDSQKEWQEQKSKLQENADAQNTKDNSPQESAAESLSGSDRRIAGYTDNDNDSGLSLDSGIRASAEIASDDLVEVTPLTDADLADGTDDVPLVADIQVSGDEVPKARASKKSTA